MRVLPAHLIIEKVIYGGLRRAMSFSKIKTAVLFARYTDQLSYYDDWQDAFLRSSAYQASTFDLHQRDSHKALKNSIRDFDFIVLLHSTNADTMDYIRPCKKLLLSRRGKLLILPGNEVNLPIVSMEEKIHFMRDIEAEFIGTQLLGEAGAWLYEECAGSRVIPLPHALNTAAFSPTVPHEKRTIDLGVRSHKYLPIIGDNDRNRLFDFFLTRPFDPPLIIDIVTTSRFNRKEWSDYLNHCRGTLANEAGSYYLERNDGTIGAIVYYLIEKRRREGAIVIREDSLLKKCARMIPAPLRDTLKDRFKKAALNMRSNPSGDILNEHNILDNVDFDEIYDLFYKNKARPPVYTKAISSRHFDAIGTKTCQIMYPGRYNDILKENVHYLSLAYDHSNCDDVIEKFRDASYRQEIADRAYDYVMENHTYDHRIETIRKLLEGGGA
jgi:spore maturation protein CgeB